MVGEGSPGFPAAARTDTLVDNVVRNHKRRWKENVMDLSCLHRLRHPFIKTMTAMRTMIGNMMPDMIQPFGAAQRMTLATSPAKANSSSPILESLAASASNKTCTSTDWE